MSMSETQTPRWMRVGTSSEPDGAVAARMAVEAALAGEDASLVIVFVAPVYDMQAVAASAHDAAGGAPLEHLLPAVGQAHDHAAHRQTFEEKLVEFGHVLFLLT